MSEVVWRPTVAGEVEPTLAESRRVVMAGSCWDLPDAYLVALIKSPRAEATSFTALINSTYSAQTTTYSTVPATNSNGKLTTWIKKERYFLRTSQITAQFILARTTSVTSG